jgi:two-component system, NtrC family, response regulator
MNSVAMPKPALKKILIIDDDLSVQASLALLLKQSGYAALACDDQQQALDLLATLSVDLILQDMNFSRSTTGEEGLFLLTEIKTLYPNVPVLLMSAWGSITLAVRGVKLGAADFFTKPWDNAQLVQLIQTTLYLSGGDAEEGRKEGELSRKSLDARFEFSAIAGEHPEILKVLATIGRVAKTKASVLILGESGTGKELIADAIHLNSPRNGLPVVKVNMGAVSSTLFESEMFGHVRGAFTDAKSDRKGHFVTANGSTLFLDEIGELNRADQVKLLRVLQSHNVLAVGSSVGTDVDVRIVCATNRELAELVAAGDFREDLFYRLNLITIRLPALRDRRSDIPLLATQLIKSLTNSYGMNSVSLAPSALAWLISKSWPGNIRQLRQSIERTLLLVGKPELGQEDFIFAEQHDESQERDHFTVDGMTLDAVEKHMIVKALETHQGNITRVAKALGLSRFALYRRLEKHHIASGEDKAVAGN